MGPKSLVIRNFQDYLHCELEPEKDSMSEEELTDFFSDLIYRVKLNNKPAYSVPTL